MDNALLSLMPDTITLEAYSTQNAYNEPTYAAATTHQCRVQGRVKMVRTVQGDEKVSTVQVYLATAAGVTVRDRVTLPTRFTPRQPVILAVDYRSDEQGAYGDVIYC